MNFIKKILKSRSENGEIFLIEIQKILGFKPHDLNVYKKAFTHSSIKKKSASGQPMNYERLEFLGDALLSSIIAIDLLKKYPPVQKDISPKCDLKL